MTVTPQPPSDARSEAADKPSRQRWLVVVIVLAVLGGSGWGALLYVRRPRLGPVARGERLASELGCFACHGPGATGGIPNAGTDGQSVPGWSGGTAMMWIENEDEIRQWILDGKLARGHDDPAGRAIEMPAYRDRLSKRQLDDLVAYYLAVSWYRDPPSELAGKGRDAAFELGCFGCHGPSGMGRLRNPGSFKGYIPGWDGPDYDDLVTSNDELHEWILDGRSSRLEANPAARFFTHRQQIQMPAFRKRITDDQLKALTAYIQSIRDGYLQRPAAP